MLLVRFKECTHPSFFETFETKSEFQIASLVVAMSAVSCPPSPVKRGRRPPSAVPVPLSGPRPRPSSPFPRPRRHFLNWHASSLERKLRHKPTSISTSASAPSTDSSTSGAGGADHGDVRAHGPDRVHRDRPPSPVAIWRNLLLAALGCYVVQAQGDNSGQQNLYQTRVVTLYLRSYVGDTLPVKWRQTPSHGCRGYRGCRGGVGHSAAIPEVHHRPDSPTSA